MTKTTGRASKSLTDFSNKSSGYLNNVSKEEAIVRGYMTLMERGLGHNTESELRSLSTEEESRSRWLAKILDDLQKPVNRMEIGIQDLQDNLQSRERTKLLQWLSPILYIQHLTQAQKGVLQDTGRWMLTDQKLLEWRISSTSPIIWLHSPPGFGKTKLV